MQRYLLLFIITFFVACGGQTQELADPRAPETPTKDSLDAWCENKMDALLRIQKGAPNGADQYFYQGELFTGWACIEYKDTPHQYRYSKYENGLLEWQIGYFSNGQLDHDFRMSEGKNRGSGRMWHEDGHLYVDNFYVEPDVLDGFQKRWYKNAVLALDALYDNGVLVYELNYDQTGKLVDSKGTVPTSK